MLGAYYDTNVNSTEYVFIETAVSLRSHAVCVREKKKKKGQQKDRSMRVFSLDNKLRHKIYYLVVEVVVV